MVTEVVQEGAHVSQRWSTFLCLGRGSRKAGRTLGGGLGELARVRPAVPVGLQVGQHAMGQAGAGEATPLPEQRLHHVADKT